MDRGNPQVRVPDDVIRAAEDIRREEGFQTRGEAIRHGLVKAGYL